jgi:D-alanyl-D-alanine carboxypeptidase
MTAAVAIPGAGLWSMDKISDPQAPLLYWASAGKTFVAVVVLQLMDEGKLSLTDSVSRWIPGVPNGDVVTVRNLLEHTSGLFSANEDLKAREHPRYRDPGENLEIAASHGAMFCPGELWRYSNTGYDLLGEIIRKADGRSFSEAITARIIAPLGLKRTRVLVPGQPANDIAALTSSKDTPIRPEWPGAAGPVAGSAGDMVLFWSALLNYRLLAHATTDLMFERLYPMFDAGTFYGLGVMAIEVPQPDGTSSLWLGHFGGTPGAQSVVLYSPADNAFVAVALTGDGSATATANLLLNQLRATSAANAHAHATAVRSREHMRTQLAQPAD